MTECTSSDILFYGCLAMLILAMVIIGNSKNEFIRLSSKAEYWEKKAKRLQKIHEEVPK